MANRFGLSCTKGADVNSVDSAGRTALMWASSRWGHTDIVGILLRAGEQSRGDHSEMTNTCTEFALISLNLSLPAQFFSYNHRCTEEEEK